MIKMPLEKETRLPHESTLSEPPTKVSPTFPASVSLSDQPKQAKTHPLRQKNGLQATQNNQAPPPAPQRIGKRRYSLGIGFKGVAKRRRRANSDSQPEPILPSHFLLGGNIFDPLNLNSLLDEDVNRLTNQETPKCSPLPARGGDPVEILVPRDITDPLNLKGEGGDGGEGGGVLLSPLKSRRRHRNRHHGGGAGAEGGDRLHPGGGADREVTPARLFPPRTSATGAAVPSREQSVEPSPLPCELNTSINCRDDIIPPILPRRHTHPPSSHAHKPRNHGDGRQRRRRRTTSLRSSESAMTTEATAATPQPTRFQTPLVGGAKAGRSTGVRALSNGAQTRKKDKFRYQHGNHSRYYGYHGFYGDRSEGRLGAMEDPRLGLLKDDWFRDKQVLDIGCGTGQVTLAVARRFGPTHILGLDQDERLVHAARQNMRHFLSHDLVAQARGAKVTDGADRTGGSKPEEQSGGEEQPRGREEKQEEPRGGEEKQEEQSDGAEEVQQSPAPLLLPLSFPASFRRCRGPLSCPPLPLLHAPSGFPNNLTFIRGDYVSGQEAWPGQGRYDVIMCLGVTKWIQLQSGDGGVVRLFKRAYQSLLPGGMFILEPQPWSSYGRSKRSSETACRNYTNVRLRPERFTTYLTDNVGYTSYQLLAHTGKHRPIYLFHKGPVTRK